MQMIATDAKEKEHLYSEIFFSPQGEGEYTGYPTVWVRFFLCNLTCDGFGQPDPTDPRTYDLPYKDFNVSEVTRVEDLPVFERGCDSSYSWAKKFKHLAKRGTAKEICDRIIDAITSESNPDGMFQHPVSKNEIHLAFTGGEPMIHQDAIVEIMHEFEARQNVPEYITIETNGTKPLTKEFKEFFDGDTPAAYSLYFMSVSPKLFNVSGEKASKAIKPEVVAEYSGYASGQLKFVLSPADAAWYDFEVALNAFREADCDYPVWIMPVGATDAGQAQTAADVARRAIAEGYNVSARAHISLFGNVVGS